MAGKQRNESIDLLRGLVMVIMTIDHVREYCLGPGQAPVGDPMDLKVVTPLVFVLRWLAHFCAPTFSFLMGVSAALAGAGQAVAERRRHLILRGFVLIALEFTIMNWAWTFNPFWRRYFFQVIGALGVAMIVLGLVGSLTNRVVFGMGVLLALGHNAFDGVRFESTTWQHYVWSVIHQKNVLPLWGGFELRTTYPVVSVIALALCGYAAAEWLRDSSDEVKASKLRLAGWGVIAAFVVLRLTNLYGDPFRFTPQSSVLLSVFSVLNTTKYPMSLQFILMTIGPALLFLSWWRARAGLFPFSDWIRLLGRTPMFYYIAHLIAAHAFALLAALALGYTPADLDVTKRYGGIPPGFGFPVWACVPFSIALAVLLTPACRWYGRVRSSGKYPVLRWL